MAARIRRDGERGDGRKRPGDTGFSGRVSQVLLDGQRRGASPPPAGGLRSAARAGRASRPCWKTSAARDARDAARAIAPMKPADDAIVVDSTGLTIEQVVERLAADVHAEGDEGCERTKGSAPEPGEAQVELGGARRARSGGDRDRSWHLIWYRFVQYVCAILALVFMRWRAKGQGSYSGDGRRSSGLQSRELPGRFFCGDSAAKAAQLRGAIDVVRTGAGHVHPLGRRVSDPARGDWRVGHEGDAQRLKAGGIVALFPEGTRSPDGELGPLKPGIAVLASRLGVPVVPAGVAGLHESWPRSRLLPVPHPVRIHYGPPILPHEMAGLDAAAITELIRSRMLAIHEEARRRCGMIWSIEVENS